MPKHYMPSEKILQVLFPKNFRKIRGIQKKKPPILSSVIANQ